MESIVTVLFSVFFCTSIFAVEIAKKPIKIGQNIDKPIDISQTLHPEGEIYTDKNDPQKNIINPEFASYNSVFIITIHGMVDGGLSSSIKRRVKIAQENGVDLIIFDLDTFGGRLDSAFEISEYISGLTGIKTIAFISQKAISAGALITLSCNEIVMTKEAELGDCEPIIPIPEGGYQTAGEKVQTVLRAKFRKFAEKNGYPPLLAEAMVTSDMEVYRIETEDKPEGLFITSKELEIMTEEEQKKIKKKKLIVEKGKLLTMHAKEAHEYGFSKYLVDNRAALLGIYGIKEDKTRELETNWSEEMVRFIGKIAPILMTIGIISLYLEFKTPGFGLPGIFGILCFATIFLSKYLVGLAEAPEIIIFFIGVALLAVELFLIPGFGVTGIAGIIMMIIGLILSFQDFTIPRTPYDSEVLRKNLFMIVSSFFCSGFVIVLLLKYMPGIPIFNRLVLTASEIPDYGFRDTGASFDTLLIGKKGITITPLHPSGRIELGEKLLDVITEGEFVEKGKTVEIIEAKGNRIIVRPV